MDNKAKTIFIGVAGGSGAGKSTLCTALQYRYPEKIGLIQLDDYFKPSDEVSTLEGYKNWDNPDSLYLNKLVDDLLEIEQGKSVLIYTKNERLNPQYKNTEKRIPLRFEPKPIMLVEGYLVLYSPKVRNMLETSIWLEIGHETRWSRRVHFKIDEYEKKVLIPMHKKYVEPTKEYAGHIIDVSNLSKAHVLEVAEGIIGDLPLITKLVPALFTGSRKV